MYGFVFGLWVVAKLISSNSVLSAKPAGKPDCGEYEPTKILCKLILVTIV
jgi:hypothetical protein